MKIITLAAQKGGTGKTTTTKALAEAAAFKGKKVLAVDLDAGNLSFSLAANRSGGTSYELITGTPAAELIQHTNTNNLDIIPAGLDNVAITGGHGSANRLKEALKPIKKKYDFIFVDTPAGAGELQYNGLLAANIVIVPVLCESFSIQTLYQFAGTVQEIQKVNKHLKAAAIIANYDKRTNLSKQMREGITDAIQELNFIYAGTVRTGSKIGESIALQKSLYEYAPNSNPAADYMTVYNLIDLL